jgi:hypothetical protein
MRKAIFYLCTKLPSHVVLNIENIWYTHTCTCIYTGNALEPTQDTDTLYDSAAPIETHTLRVN